MPKSRMDAPQVREEILAFLRGYIAEHGFSPTDTEIGKSVGRSQQAVSMHMQKLAADGRIVIHGMRRAVTVLPDPTEETA